MIVVVGLLATNSSCNSDRHDYTRRPDASQQLDDAGRDVEIADSGVKPALDGGKAGSGSASGGNGDQAGAGAGAAPPGGNGDRADTGAGGGAGAAANGGHGTQAGAGTSGNSGAGSGGTEADVGPGDAAVSDAGNLDASVVDAQVQDASCDLDEDAGTQHTDSFTVPSEGGHFDFCSTSGVVGLDFPSALAGLQMTLTTLEPQSFAWPHPGFAAAMSDTIRIETNTSITQPIRIRLPNGALLAFVFYPGSTVPLPLRLSDDRMSLELEHSGVLGILAPDRSCESTLGAPFTNAWQETPLSGMCSGFGSRSTWRHYECANEPFCQEIKSWCCVYPDDTSTGCAIEDGIVYNDFWRADPNAAYAYCDGISDSPYILDVSPSQLVANYMDQTVTLTGNNFQQGGYATADENKHASSNVFIRQSTWISSTQISAVVSGLALRPVSELWYMYVNPGNGGQFEWFNYSNSIRGAVVQPAVSCPVPLEGSPPVGSCRSLSNGCQCSVDFDPGDGVHTYAMSCTNDSCTCTRDSLIVTTKPRINACNNDRTTQDQWMQSCLSTPGFCP